MKVWYMWAHDYVRNFSHIGKKHWVEMHMLKDHPIVEVRVELDPEGAYYGWLKTGEDRPTMIWPTKIQFEMCFPYGPEASEKAGNGKTVRLSITQAEPVEIRRFMGSYRRYRCNWSVFRGDEVACDEAGNVWAFHTRKQTQDYLSNHEPALYRGVDVSQGLETFADDGPGK